MILRLALLALLAGGSASAEEVMTLQWESGVIPLGTADLARATAVKEGVMVQLGPRLAGKFADLTELLIGESMAILVCGREIVRPVIQARIEGGSLLVPVPDPVATAAVLSGHRPCKDLPVDE